MCFIDSGFYQRWRTTGLVEIYGATQGVFSVYLKGEIYAVQ